MGSSVATEAGTAVLARLAMVIPGLITHDPAWEVEEEVVIGSRVIKPEVTRLSEISVALVSGPLGEEEEAEVVGVIGARDSELTAAEEEEVTGVR